MSNVAVMKMGLLRMYCPGCRCSHQVPVDTGSGDWTWNGSLTAPTLSPSLLVLSHFTYDENDNMAKTPRCHSFVRNGQWQFLGDCTHDLAGQTVVIPPYEKGIE